MSDPRTTAEWEDIITIFIGVLVVTAAISECKRALESRRKRHLDKAKHLRGPEAELERITNALSDHASDLAQLAGTQERAASDIEKNIWDETFGKPGLTAGEFRAASRANRRSSTYITRVLEGDTECP